MRSRTYRRHPIRRRTKTVVALGATVALLAPAAAQAEPDRHPMDPLGANFGPAAPGPSEGESPRAPNQPRLPGSDEGPEAGSGQDGDGSSSTPDGREGDATETTRPVETDETNDTVEPDETETGGSVADRIARAWPGNDRKALQVARCESGLNPNAYNPAGPYYGLWQFDVRTWRGVGGSGVPSDASVEEQTRRAWTLRSRNGWGPWPVCG